MKRSVFAKFFKVFLFIAFLFSVTLNCPAIEGAEKIRNIRIEGSIIDNYTNEGIITAVKVEVLNPDSTLLATSTSSGFTNRYTQIIEHSFRLTAKTDQEKLILKLSSPDYKTLYLPLRVNKAVIDLGRILMRPLSNYEKVHNLQEFTVTASVVQFVNKGDTISYNANAFALAEGSMLDALVEQLPGVEIRENGQIFVNGRFVDKLMLDGKDFFKGNQLVLLQNLPAYTIKNIKVYEEAQTMSKVLGKQVQNPNEKDPLVMDVVLKKGYNTSWILNAEAGAGTSDRYRARAFATGFTRSVRIGAYGFANNINETRNPGRNGNWSPASSQKGLTSTKEGGVDYQFTTAGNRFDMNGNAIVSYKDMENNSRINKQNFLTNSDTYTYSWTDASSRDLNVSTAHTLKLQPATGNRYATRLQLDLTYQDNKDETDQTEGNFNTPQSVTDKLRGEIEEGFSDDTDMINRYISRAESKQNDLKFHWDLKATFATGTVGGLSILAHGYFNRGNYRDRSAYLLQTAQSKGESVARRNPRDYHSYQNWMGVSYTWKINDRWSFTPMYGYCQWYKYNSDMWYKTSATDMESPDLMGNLPSVNDAMMVFDRPNSYTTGWRSGHHYIAPSLSYYHTTYLDGKEYSQMRIKINPAFNVTSRRLDFHGETEQRVKRDYINWEPSIFFGWNMRNMAPYVSLEYKYKTGAMDLMDLVDVLFTTDPLNLKMGNPELRNSSTHVIEGLFNSKKWYFNRLMVNVSLKAEFTQDKVAMGYSYDRTTGVKRWMPMNVNGNRSGFLNFNTTLALDRAKRFQFKNTLWFYPRRSVDMLSYDEFESTHKSIVNSMEINENARFEYTFGKSKNMVALDFKVTNRKATSPDLDVHDVNITRYSYGVRGRATLPWNIEFTTDLKMYSNRGFENSSMNDNQLVWNARLQKKFPKTGISVIVDGYDILGNVKNISYQVDSQGRTEKWVNSVPDYVMLSIRWDFAKKHK